MYDDAATFSKFSLDLLPPRLQQEPTLSLRRSKLAEEVVSGIMFVKENLEVLQKHYGAVTKGMDVAQFKYYGLSG